jgi:signal transduction histidine kinase
VRLEVTARPGQIVRFVVLDDGPGIEDKEFEQVFERFHRTDDDRSRKTGGAGLGLAIVRAIARAHGGEARAVSATGHAGDGARLELELPRLRAVRVVSAEALGEAPDALAERRAAAVQAGLARAPRPPAADRPDSS